MQKKIADHSYQTEDVIQRALAYAQNDARLCAVEVRQAAKLCQMMADRDMKDYLETSTQRFCERMYNLIYFIQGIKEDDPKSGDGLQLIRAVRGLFNMSIVIGARGCIVNQMFEKEEVRLTGIRVKALQRESDEAWAEQVGMASREGWIWHSKEKEWRPAYTQHTSAEEEEGSSDEEMPHIDWEKQDISSGSEDEAMERAWLERVAAGRGLGAQPPANEHSSAPERVCDSEPPAPALSNARWPLSLGCLSQSRAGSVVPEM